MRTEKIEGFGNINGGKYDRIEIRGIGSTKDDIIADSFYIEGIGKCKGAVETREFICDGVAQLSKSLRAKHITIDGFVKQAKGKIEADDIYCDGVLITNGEISADSTEVDGSISAPEIYGDKVKIIHNFRDKGHFNFNVPDLFGIFGGRTVEKNYSNVDIIEATSVELYCVKSVSVSGNRVIIDSGCEIKTVECDGTLRIHPDARVGKIIGVDPMPWDN